MHRIYGVDARGQIFLISSKLPISLPDSNRANERRTSIIQTMLPSRPRRSSESHTRPSLHESEDDSFRLPSDEYARLQIRQKIESLYDSPRLPASTPSNPSSTRRSWDLTDEQRVQASEVRFVTRKKLVPSFEFRVDSRVGFGGCSPRPSVYNRTGQDLIPQRYMDEYNEMFDSASNSTSHLGKSSYEVHREHVLSAADGGTAPELMQHLSEYETKYGSESRILPKYRVDGSGRPARMMTEAFKPVKSSFEWSDSDCEEGQKRAGSNGKRKSLLGRRRESRDSEKSSRSRRVYERDKALNMVSNNSWEAPCLPNLKKPRYYATALIEEEKTDLKEGITSHEWTTADMLNFEESRKALALDPRKEVQVFPPGSPEHEAAKEKLAQLAKLEQEEEMNKKSSTTKQRRQSKNPRSSRSPVSPLSSPSPGPAEFLDVPCPNIQPRSASSPIPTLLLDEPRPRRPWSGISYQPSNFRARSNPNLLSLQESAGEIHEPLPSRPNNGGDYFSHAQNRDLGQVFLSEPSSPGLPTSTPRPPLRRVTSGDGNLSRSNARRASQQIRTSSRIRSPLANEVTFRVNPDISFDNFVVRHPSGKGEVYYRGSEGAAIEEKAPVEPTGEGLMKRSSKRLSKMVSMPSLKGRKSRNSREGSPPGPGS
ncbi:hypothetical protein BCR34DRAFT_606285 [Clohesyomyces aquaticus]|uniref:Pal1 cell morphology protein-domain-containing protein n=1 Tax=Clohesyomyces aquaticus TaxID=1231657 RepID=A0A1Y1YQZ8_9PLEO|nr:hypothetical protein BCR34DRAFT_606285 [Clohesyomyces aquaticus]